MQADSYSWRSSEQTRRRGSALDDALLDAAWAELREVGYAGLTRRRRAAGRDQPPVLARRWPNRPQLVIAALRRHRPVLSGEVPTPETSATTCSPCSVGSRPGSPRSAPNFYGLAADYFADPALIPDFHAQIFQTGNDVMAAILTRAAERGEVKDDIPARVAASS